MKTVSNTMQLPCTPDEFWKVFFDEAYTCALYKEALEFRDFQVLERTESSRRTRCVPKMNLPGPLAKLVGDSFAYEEHGDLDRQRGEWSWRMMPPAGNAKPLTITTRGTMRITAEGSGCRRSDEVVAEAKIFGLGGMIESTIEKEVRAGWAKEQAFLARWLATPRLRS